VYEGVKQTGGGARWYFLKSIRPGDPEPPEIPKNVATISPNFVKIYTQASDAEQHGLSEICGGGYRKALEFLVKDFIISQAESLGITGDQVKKASLGQCIENYISDPLTKGVAERATWLGNDETHYFRKWVDKDINDLKNLIRLTMNAVDNHLLAHSYLADMGEGK